MRAFARFCALDAVVAVVAAAAVGCHHPQVWHAQPVATPFVRIEPLSVSASGDRLFVETMLFNTSPETMMVSRDDVTLTLSDGRTLGRSSGTTTLHQPYVVPASGSHRVYVDFRADGFQWRDVGGAQVNFTGALTIRGQLVAAPPLFVSPHLRVVPPGYAPAPQPTYYAPPQPTGAPPPPAPTANGAIAPPVPNREAEPRRPR